MTDSWPQHLLSWYRQHRRHLPWRELPEPYRVWVSEIMLQQTQVETVKPYFERFLAAFPTVEALAAADPQAVLKLWEGLGYYSRARRLQETARLLAAEYGGRLPETYEALLTLPGFGPYTAAAVASIAFGKPVPVVDGNVLRVYARLTGMADDVSLPKTRQAVFAGLTPAIESSGSPGDFNQALMELGALVCRPQNPTCLLCPLRDDCTALREGRVDELPVKSRRQAVPHVRVVAGVIRRDGRLLVVQRPVAGMLGGMWELPGGRRDDGEPLAEALVHQVRRATGVTVSPGRELCTVQHGYSHFTVSVTAVAAEVASGDATDGRWAAPVELAALPFSRVTHKVFEQLDKRREQA